MLATLPDRPMKDESKRSSHRRMTVRESRLGSVVMKTTCTLAATEDGSWLTAAALRAMSVGQTSGQLVYPKYTSVIRPRLLAARSKGAPLVSVRGTAGAA